MNAFDHLETWPCPNVAAAVLGPDGTVATHGDTTQVFALASITKLFTAVAVHLAVEEGTATLEDVVDDHGSTVADLLGHASGLSPQGDRLDEPGRRRIYSNAGYEIVATTVETNADMPFADYLHEGVFAPLEMGSTRLLSSPAFGAASTIDDLVRFLRGLPTLLAPTTIDTMVTPYLPELVGVLPGYGRQTPNTWGLGPEIRSTKSPHWTGTNNAPGTWGHFGATGTFVWTDPEAEASLIVLTDRDFGEWAIPLWTQLSDAVLAELAT